MAGFDLRESSAPCMDEKLLNRVEKSGYPALPGKWNAQ
jgi:hypothetical protein